MRKVLNRDSSITVKHRMTVANPVSEQEYVDTQKRMESFCPDADFFEIYDKNGMPAKISYADDLLKQIKANLTDDK